MPEWCESPETRAAAEEALAKRREARRLMKSGELPKASPSDFGAAVGISRDVGVFGNEAAQVNELVDLVVLLVGCCDLQCR